MTRLAIALAAAVLLLAACGDGTEDTSSIQPIEAILDSDIDITVDPSGTT